MDKSIIRIAYLLLISDSQNATRTPKANIFHSEKAKTSLVLHVMQALTRILAMNNPVETISKQLVTCCSISLKVVCLGRVFLEGVKMKSTAISRKRKLKLLLKSYVKDSQKSLKNS